MADLGQAYVQIVASAEGIAGSVTSVLDPEAKKAGTKAGSSVLTNMSAQFTKGGKAMTAGVTVPIAAIGGASIVSFKEVHTGLENIITKTGATGAALDDMEGIMNNIGQTVPTDFGNIGNAIGEVNTRFGVTGDELEDLSTKFLQYADINNTDVSTSIDLVQQAMDAFGMEAGQTADMLDVLTKVGQNTGINVDQLAASMVTNSAALHEMGFDASEAAQFLGELEVAGVDSSQVMSGMKKALAEAAAEGKPLDQALSELQDSIMNASDSTEAMNIATELFGARSGPAIAEACQNGVIDFNDLGMAVEDAGGSVTDTFEATLTPLDQFQMAMNTAKEAGAGVGAALLESLVPIIEQVAGVIQKVLDAWNGLSPETQQMIIKIAMIAAAIGPMLLAVGKIITTITTIISTVKMLGAAFSMLAMGPVGLIIAAIAAAVAIGIYLYTHWDEIKPKLQAIWEKIKNIAMTVWNVIKTVIITPIQTAWQIIKAVFNAVRAFLISVWNVIKTVARTVWNAIKSAVVNPIQTAKSLVLGAVNAIRSTVSSVFNAIRSIASTVWNGIKTAITQPIETAKNTVKGILDRIKGFFPLSIGKIFSNLKVPKIDITAGKAPFGIGGLGTKPSIKVSWNAKAMNNPFMFSGATLFGAGEAGDEILYGRRALMHDIQQATQTTAPDEARINAVLKRMDLILDELEKGHTVSIGKRDFARLVNEVG